MFDITAPKAVQEVTTLKWYYESQNNSGGYFIGPAKNIWIQASSREHAQGIFKGLDLDYSFCDCCGERWGDMDWVEGTEFPERYGERLDQLKEKPFSFGKDDVVWGLLVYIDGQTKTLEID